MPFLLAEILNFQGSTHHFDVGSFSNKLKESYVIFICTFDEFGKGRHVYSFENRCKEDLSIRLNDGTHKIFLCAKGTMDDCSEKMKEFLDYIAGKETKGELSDRLREEVEHSKANEKWRKEYMLFSEKLEEEYEKGEAEGRAEGVRLLDCVIERLRNGEAPEDIRESGVDSKIIEIAGKYA